MTKFLLSVVATTITNIIHMNYTRSFRLLFASSSVTSSRSYICIIIIIFVVHVLDIQKNKSPSVSFLWLKFIEIVSLKVNCVCTTFMCVLNNFLMYTIVVKHRYNIYSNISLCVRTVA